MNRLNLWEDFKEISPGRVEARNKRTSLKSVKIIWNAMGNGDIKIPVSQANCVCHSIYLIVTSEGVPLKAIFPKHEGGQIDYNEIPPSEEIITQAHKICAYVGIDCPIK